MISEQMVRRYLDNISQESMYRIVLILLGGEPYDREFVLDQVKEFDYLFSQEYPFKDFGGGV